MSRDTLVITLALLATAACGDKATRNTSSLSEPAPAASDKGLRSPADFAHIADPGERSLALFDEVGKVILHPRCVNCHPNGDRPLQGVGLPHQPLVVRGPDGRGAPGLPCSSCHGSENFEGVPGREDWHLAPQQMAWLGKSLGQICEQIKDPQRNGGKSMAQLAHHMAHDHLVAYGWSPPDHLAPVPGNQVLFAELFQAWIDAGAQCPAP